MLLLPPPEEQALLLDALAELVRARGAETLLDAPIVEPSDEFFPDRWSPDANGVRVLTARLLAYAGLGGLSLEVAVGEGTEVTAQEGLPGVPSLGWKQEHAGAAAWFRGIAKGTCYFGVDGRQLDDPEGLAGTMCHEVAHAYRHHHGLSREDDEEELLTDVTTIYLGFGVLTTNTSDRFRTYGDARSMGWKRSSAGYLPPEEMSFLLGAQAVARRLEGPALRRLRGRLEPNQAASFRAACKLLSRTDLAARLGAPIAPLAPEGGFWAKLRGLVG